MKNIVLNIPHSSTVMPGSSIERWAEGIDSHIVEHCDLLSKKIFSTKIENVKTVVFDYSRFYCDVERLADDPLEKIGQGIYYTKYKGLERTNDDYEDAMKLYREYINRLSECLNEDSILIDCHTFSNDVAPDIDICIGFNDDFTKPNDEFIDNVKKLFESRGFNVKLNEPYANSISPKTGFRYKSMMIEINKNIYLRDKMDPDSELASSYKLNALINYLFRKILDEWNFKD